MTEGRNYDQARSGRLGQPVPVSDQGLQFATGANMPVAPWDGQLIFRLDLYVFQVYSIDENAWLQQDVGEQGPGNKTFVQPTAPAADMVGDLWINTSTPANRLYFWDGDSWELSVDPAVQQAQNAAAQALEAATAAQDVADGKITVFYGAQQPTGAKEGDLWFKQGTNEVSKYASGAWVNIDNPKLAQALQAAADARAIADKKVQAFYSATAPEDNAENDLGEGDIWVSNDTVTLPGGLTQPTNLLHRWDGTQWLELPAGAGSIAPGAIGPEQIQTGGVPGAALGISDRIDFTGGRIVVYRDTLDADGKRVAMIVLDPKGSSFRGSVQADDISVMNGLLLIGTMSRITPGAIITMDSAVNDPQQPLQMAQGLRTLSWANPAAYGSSLTIKSVNWNTATNQYDRLIWQSSSKRAFVDAVDASGSAVSGSFFELPPGAYPHQAVSGLIRQGSTGTYFMWSLYNDNGTYWHLVRYSKAGTAQGAAANIISRSQAYSDYTGWAPFLGYDDAGAIYSLRSTQSLSIAPIDLTFAANQSPFVSGGIIDLLDTDGNIARLNDSDGYQPSWIGRGAFDFSGNRWVVHWPRVTKTYGINLREVTAESWTHEYRIPFSWSPTFGAFLMMSASTGEAWQFSNFNLDGAMTSSTHKILIGYTYRSSTENKESKLSPIKSLPLSFLAKRGFLAVGAALDLPAGVNSARLYSRLVTVGTAETAATLRLRAETLTLSSPTPELVGFTPSAIGPETGAAPPTNSSFASGNPGRFRSQSGIDGIIDLRGDGFASIPDLQPKTRTTQVSEPASQPTKGAQGVWVRETLAANGLQLYFRAPSTGAVRISFQAYLVNLSTSVANMYFGMGLYSADSSTLIREPRDYESLVIRTQAAAIGMASGTTFDLDGLTPGVYYTMVSMHKVDSASAANPYMSNRRVLIAAL